MNRFKKIFASVLLIAGLVYCGPAYSQYRALWYTNGDTVYPIQALYLKVPHVFGSTVWGQIDSIPPALDTLVSPATGSGIYLDSTHLGYYSGGQWKTYMDNTGKFYLGGTSGALQWNGTTLTISATLSGNGGGITNINGGNIQTGTVTATQISSGYVYAGTINASQINASSLSAISANLGTITAGNITGATFVSSNTNSAITINSTNQIIFDVLGTQVGVISGSDSPNGISITGEVQMISASVVNNISAGSYSTGGTAGYLSSAFGTYQLAPNTYVAGTSGGVNSVQLHEVSLTINGQTYYLLTP